METGLSRFGRRRLRRLSTILTGVVVAFLPGQIVLANSATWDGDSAVGIAGDGVNWSNANNWSDNGVVDVAPSSTSPGDDLTFGAGTVGTINLGSADRYANSITFTAGFTLGTQGSTATINISSGDVTVDSGVSATINAPLGNNNLTLDGGGTLTLGGNNDFRSGNFTIDNGTLVAGYITSLGFSSEQINANGTLDLNTANNGIGSITNAGTININAAGAGVSLVTNSGNVNVNASAGFGSQTNNGTYTIAAGVAFTGFSGSNFFQNAGTLTVNGSMSLSNATFYDNGGTISGAISLGNTDSTLSFGTLSPSGGTFNFIGSLASGATFYTADINGSADSAGTTINVDPSNTTTLGQFTLNVATPFTNAGTMNVLASGLNHTVNFGENGTNFYNTGTLNMDPGPTADGGRVIDLAISNSGTFNLNASATYEAPMTNTGTLTIAAGKTLVGLQNSNTSFTQISGTLTINGGLTINGSTFADNGGTINGTVIIASDNQNPTLSFGTNPASGGTFNFVGGINSNNSYYSANISGTIPAGVTVNVNPSNSASLTTFTVGLEPYPFTNAGTLNLLATNQNHNIVIEGELNNTGTLNINPGPSADGGRTFEGSLTNSGTANINAATAFTEGFSNSGTMNVNASVELSNEDSTNSGSLTVAAGATLGHTTTNNAPVNFTQSAGALTINGTLELVGGTFYDNGGTISGPVNLIADSSFTLSFGTSPASGGTFNFDEESYSTYADVYIDGNIPAGATINLAPSVTIGVVNMTAELQNSFTNVGTINLSATGQNHNLTLQGGNLTNTGTININPGPTADGSRTLELALTNSGTLNLNASTTFTQGMINDGALTIAAGKTLSNGQSASFTQAGGTLTINGTLRIDGGTFYDNGGAITGSGAIVLACNQSDPTLSIGLTLVSGGTFDFVGADTSNITNFSCTANVTANTIPASMTLNFAPDATTGLQTLTAEIYNTSINAGTINLSASGQAHNVVLQGNSLANTGTININPGPIPGGERSLQFTLTNSGTLNVNANSAASTLTNTGAINIASGTTFNTGNFTQSSGTLAINGNLELSNSTFTDNGGTITGAVTLLSNSGTPQLTINDSHSTGTFDFIGSTSTATYADANIASSIPSGVTVNIEPSNTTTPGNLTLNFSSTNAGTMNLLALNQNNGIMISDQFTNTGTLNINPGPTADGARAIEFVTNSGTINVNASTTFSNIHSSGNITVAAGKTFGAAGTFYAQTAGTLTINGIMSAQAILLGGGTVNVDGSATFGSALFAMGGATMNIPGGILSITPHIATDNYFFLNSLSITAGGRLDLTNNALMINTTDPYLIGTVENDLSTGYAAGAWDGAGIISSTAVGQSNHAASLGYNVTGPTSIYIKYTWIGDTNLDGVVNSSDLTAMVPAGTSNATWQTGDFNYDGVVNSDDYALFMLGFAASGGANISTTLPEPSVLSLMIFSAGCITIRRRRER